MLPTAHRMRRREEFALAVRRGRRSGSAHLVAHLLLPGPTELDADMVTTTDDDLPTRGHQAAAARVGFVVSRGVGGAVVRNRVRRRLRALVGQRLHQLPAGSLLVLRASPAAAAASSPTLAGDLDRTLGRLLRTAKPAS